MKIVIDIPDEVYEFLLQKQYFADGFDVTQRVMHGTPLPKGHGAIVDVEVLKAVLPIYVFHNEQGQFCKISDIDKIPPFAVVIEADKEVDE